MPTLVFTLHNVTAKRATGFISNHREKLEKALRDVAKEYLGRDVNAVVSFVGDAPSGEDGTKPEGPVVIAIEMHGYHDRWTRGKMFDAAERFLKVAKVAMEWREFVVTARSQRPADSWTTSS